MKRFAGFLLLLGVIGVVTLLVLRGRGGGNMPLLPGRIPGAATSAAGTASAVTLRGLIGGEKTAFLSDVTVQKILHERYALTLDFDKRGSLEMVRGEQPKGRDFLWPSSQVALDLYKTQKQPLVRAEILFNSPIVLYSWGPVTDALIRQKVVQKINSAYYVVDFPKLIRLINSGATWNSIGLPQLYGRILIYSTDPTQSNSGNMFAGLLGNILNNGAVLRETDLPKVLPHLRAFFDNQGFMESSSETLFRQFLNKGIGDKPIIVGYEAQMIGYSREDAPRYQNRKKDLRLLYPRPTVWSSHPLIALTDNGRRLIDALQDKEIQQIAWERYGFRSAVGADNDVKAVAVPGIPETIENVIPMPSPVVMERLTKSLATAGG